MPAMVSAKSTCCDAMMGRSRPRSRGQPTDRTRVERSAEQVDRHEGWRAEKIKTESAASL